MIQVKVLGIMALIDEGENSHIIVKVCCDLFGFLKSKLPEFFFAKKKKKKKKSLSA